MRTRTDKNGNRADLEHQHKHSSDLGSTSDTDTQDFVYGGMKLLTKEQQLAFVERITRKQLARFRREADLNANASHNIEEEAKNSESGSNSDERSPSTRYFTRKRKNDEENLAPPAVDASQAQKLTKPSKASKLILHKSPTDDAKAKTSNGEPPKKKKRINLVTIHDRERTPAEEQRYLLIESYQVMKAAKRQLRKTGAHVTPVDGIDGIDDESSDDSEDSDFSGLSD